MNKLMAVLIFNCENVFLWFGSPVLVFILHYFFFFLTMTEGNSVLELEDSFWSFHIIFLFLHRWEVQRVSGQVSENELQ